ncbi:MAG: microcin ABC transporter permease, partial [Rhodospirillales bacterium]|nr:microcin ABC transporter permease [Rhodospirillales bacterium]
MLAYIIRRLLLIIPTLFGIMVINFAIVQVVPGGPVEQAIAQLTGQGVAATNRISRAGSELDTGPQPRGGEAGGVEQSRYRGAQGLDPEFIKSLERQYGLDKPAGERFLLMMKNYLMFDFGESYFRGRPVVEVVLEKMPVSISLGIWTTLLTYLISIPLGIAKARRDGMPFDVWTSGA